MTEETGPAPNPEASGEPEFDVHFVALVNLIAQLSAQLLQENRLDEARGLIDGLGALQKKTEGNLLEPEAKLVETVLFQLRMAALAAGEQADAEDSAEKDGAPHNGDDSAADAGSAEANPQEEEGS